MTTGRAVMTMGVRSICGTCGWIYFVPILAFFLLENGVNPARETEREMCKVIVRLTRGQSRL